MSRLRRRDNRPEMAVRRLLHAAGLRYRVAYRIPGQRRRTIDIALTRHKLAVYIDGCFWHSCPDHLHLPKANRDWWMRKMAMNRSRDAASTAQLEALGWTVLRFWEHEAPDRVAAAIITVAGKQEADPGQDLSVQVRALLDTGGGCRPARTRAQHHPCDDVAAAGSTSREHAANSCV